MDYINLRQLSADKIKQIRSQVVRIKEMGKSGKEIEEITGYGPIVSAKYGQRISGTEKHIITQAARTQG